MGSIIKGGIKNGLTIVISGKMRPSFSGLKFSEFQEQKECG